MKGLAVATWRLPHTSIDDLEQAREQVGKPGTNRSRRPADAFVLTTCQRVLLAAQPPDQTPAEQLAIELAGATEVPGAERFVGFQAMRHLAEVASSLDALVPGEDQVPRQFRDAVRNHADHGLIDATLHGTLQRVLAIARTVRGESGLQGRTKRSLADLAVPLLPERARVAVLGTGQMARATLTSLGPDRVTHVVSRDPDRAAERAPASATAVNRGSFLASPPAVDALLLCTSANGDPILGLEDARALLEARGEGQGPLLVLDLGLPRNADPLLASLPGVDLRTIGDLARVSRGRLLEDEHLATARQALETCLQREHDRQVKQQLSDHITEMRRSVAAEIQALVTQLAEEHPELDTDDIERVARRSQGRLAHLCQEHLLQAAQGEAPRWEVSR